VRKVTMSGTPETTAVWHKDENGNVVEPSESESGFEEESYTNWE